MKKKIVAAILLSTALLATGCAANNAETSKTTEKAAETADKSETEKTDTKATEAADVLTFSPGGDYVRKEERA